MNIFYLHEDPSICAKYHNDSHCVKMILEYAQLMCTAHRELDVISKGSLMDVTLYKSKKTDNWDIPFQTIEKDHKLTTFRALEN